MEKRYTTETDFFLKNHFPLSTLRSEENTRDKEEYNTTFMK